MDKLKDTRSSPADRVVLITGAGKGSGRLLAQAFGERGWIVAANDISPINVEELVERIISRGGQAKAYVEDVAKKVGAQNIINQVQDDFGRIDILINHAAVEPRVPLLEMDEWDWHRVLDVNLSGAFLMIQSVGRVMRAQGSGVMISLIGRPAEKGNSESAFVASMLGLDALTRHAASELKPYGIHVYSLANIAENIVEEVFALLDSPVEE